MTTPYEGAPPLTDEQRAVVDLPADEMALVIAGAGAGKTHTLVRRLDALVDREGLGAGEILVLSFSRAAVRELKERLARHGDAARHVRVRTFDSWALELLTQVDAARDWRSRDFDARIVAAAELMGDDAVNDLYEDLRHVVIDEVQDLVGERRELVEALLDTYECGFTVVGDPAQAIYGFQVRDPEERAGETNRFFDWLRARFGEELTELRLSRNFRAATDEARVALPFGPRLQAGAEGRGRVAGVRYEELRTALLDTLLIGDLEDEFVCAGLRDHDGTTAILCRTNGQALLVSELLHAGGVPHRVQRSARDRAVPAWVGLMFRRAESSIVTRSDFEELAKRLPLPADMPPRVLWTSLLRSLPNRSNTLDLSRFRTLIAEGRVPDELTAQPSAALTVSSMHRAKGLEFDRVLVMDPDTLRDDVQDQDEETRMLYVAMTRARHELMRLAPLKTWPMYPAKDRSGRWGRYQVRKRSWRLGIELVAGDVDGERPAGSHLLLPDDVFDKTAAALQDHLAEHVSPGDAVVLRRLEDGSPYEFQAPRYVVVHEPSGVAIGLTSEQFAKELYSHMKWSKNHVPDRWPVGITGMRIDAVETVAGSASAGSMAGLGEHGVWLAPRPVGLGRFTYDPYVHGGEAENV
ncbi:ATP-dependent helicase [Actinomadura sp. NPDC049382]|uniref:ATP-dependent helicase n=1 Tax=Actinomadura sp. NPDC049382 TaxID=3158220 RepID=UPI003444C94F